MVYEVCVLLLTIVFSIVGIYLIILLHAANGLITDVKKAFKVFNSNLPGVLSDMRGTVSGVENLIVTTQECMDLIRCKIISPLYSVVSLLDAFKVGFKAWRIIQKEQSKKEPAKTESEPGKS
jgi:uncharacterized protein YoxC